MSRQVIFLLQDQQVNHFSPVLAIWCSFRQPLSVKFLSQYEQARGCSPVWKLWCTFKLPLSPCKVLGTRWTGTLIFSGVKPLVCYQTAFLCGTVVTRWAGRSFFSSASPLVHIKIASFSDKVLVTGLAGKFFFSGVCEPSSALSRTLSL